MSKLNRASLLLLSGLLWASVTALAEREIRIEKLMREHMQTMQENMQTMGGMGGPMMMGGSLCGGMMMGGKKDGITDGDMMKR